MMKRKILQLAVCAALFSPCTTRASEVWKEVSPNKAPKELQLIQPEKFRVYALEETTLGMQLRNLPADPGSAQLVSVPMPDGSNRDFRVWATPMMPASLAQQYPEIMTFSGTAVDDATVTAKFDLTLYGFHAMVFDGENTAFIDPFDNFHDGYYVVYYKHDLNRPVDRRMQCLQHGLDEHGPAGEQMETMQNGLPKLAYKTINGYDKRTYRLALACSSQYAIAATGTPTPTKAQVLSKMTTTMNRVNGVYEREFSVTMEFVASENSLIFIASSGDPYFAINSNAGSCLSVNQTQCNTLVGLPNYDIGHVFTTGSGGLATLGCVCTFGKAQGTTGNNPLPTGDPFDIDYVAHEMGHQFGATHSFNDGVNGSCGGGNAEATTAYEPGSGSTIAAYAGICSPDNVQSHSDAYFHRASVSQIISLINAGGNCAAKTATGNKMVQYNPFSPTSYTIPYMTPFELTAPTAVDSAGDSVTLYCWEEHDLGSFGSTFTSTSASGPIFRSINPSKSSTRVFPKISSVLAGNLNVSYEKAPTVARDMKFKCIYRNIRNNMGSISVPDEVVTVSAITTGSGAGFKVTSQGSSPSYVGGSTQTVTWSVLNTNISPIGAANVDIWMSQNGGTTYQYLVGTFPNTGSASITVPNPATTTTTARFKVKGTGNVFFNVNSSNFTVENNPSLPISFNGASGLTAPVNEIKVFPVPANDVLHVTTSNATKATIFNVVGQQVWEGNISGNAEIGVETWAKGMYYARFVDVASGVQTVKQVVVR